MKIIIKGPLAELLWGIGTTDTAAASHDPLSPASAEDDDPALIELVGCSVSENA